MTTEADDTALVSAFLAGESSAFDVLVERYREKLYGVAFSILRCREDADEIANDALVRAHRGLCRFRGECSLSSWLHGLTRNLAINRYHLRNRRGRNVTDSLDEAVGDSADGTLCRYHVIPSGDMLIPETLELAELEREVRSAIMRISPEHRQVLILRLSMHLDYQEMAETVGCGVGTIKSRVSRARESLKAELPKEMVEA